MTEITRAPITRTPGIDTCLWLDTQAEEAVDHYVSIFPGAERGEVTRYGDDAAKMGGKQPGSVLTASFRVGDRRFVLLNGGPQYRFSEAISFVIHCETQDEVDHYWARLSEGGTEGPCGWLKDRFGVSWQVVPTELYALIGDPDREKAARATHAMLTMKKLELSKLRAAHAGGA